MSDNLDTGGAGPLRGMKVLDIATLIAAPMAATYLADFGADVIKVEHPQGDPLRRYGWAAGGTSLWWKVVNRGKRCITLNLKLPTGARLLQELLRDADVLVENFRPGTLEKWGLGWERLSAANPRLIMLRTTGFGQTGPYRDRPGFGTLAEALSGFADANGFPDRPPLLPPYALGDEVCGLFGTNAIMYAIYERDIVGHGKGQFIDLSICESLFSILGPMVSVYDQLGLSIGRHGNRLPFASPRNVYETMDNKWVALSASSQSMAERVFHAIGRSDLANDPRFADNERRVENNAVLDEIISEWIKRHMLSEVMEQFEASHAAIAPVYGIGDILEDAQYRAREAVSTVADLELGSIRMQSAFPKLSVSQGSIRWAGQQLGHCNEDVLVNELGLTLEQVASLRAEGVI